MRRPGDIGEFSLIWFAVAAILAVLLQWVIFHCVFLTRQESDAALKDVRPEFGTTNTGGGRPRAVRSAEDLLPNLDGHIAKLNAPKQGLGTIAMPHETRASV